MNEALALVALAVSLAAAVARPRWAPEWAVALLAAAVLVAVGALSFHAARSSLGQLGPTVGFLAALLVLADGSRRAGVFEALGGWMALGAHGTPRRLLMMVFLAASLTTAVLSLDATIVLLTPIVFTTAARLPTNPRPHVYACSHLANTGSVLLPVSNLTNLLALRASGLSFGRFAGLMVLPWLVALGGAAEPTFLVFVLALGVVVSAAGRHGLSSVVDSLIPHGGSVMALMAIAGVSAALANLVNNLPATLIILPVAAAAGPGSVLAMLLGVNVGPNLTYVGSLATLLWRRIVHAHDHETDIAEFTRLGAVTVPTILVASTLALWLALQVL